MMPPVSRFIVAGAAALSFFVFAGAAHAFGADNEARRAILELRALVEQQREEDRAQRQRAEEDKTQLRGSLLDLANQIETLRREIALLRGKDEELAREVSELQRRQKDIAQGVEQRLRQFEPAAVTVDGREIRARPDEKSEYDNALTLFRQGDYDLAATALQSFRKRFPESGYTDSVLFWLGNALYGQRSYQEAIGSFQLMVSRSADHPRVPEALLSIANSQIELKDNRAARATLDRLIKEHPDTDAARAGRERLALLR